MTFLTVLVTFESLLLTFSHALEKKDFPFFPAEGPRPEPSPKPSPCRLPFLYKKEADLRPQKEGILGKKIACGRVGWTGAKKGKKGAQKNVGLSNF